jgi:hypothetical protein
METVAHRAIKRVSALIVPHPLKELLVPDTASAGWERPAGKAIVTLADKQHSAHIEHGRGWQTNEWKSFNSVEMSTGA